MDVNQLTLGEIEEVERRAGIGIRAMQDPDKPIGKMTRAIALVMMRRSNPTVKWEDTEGIGMEEAAALMAAAEPDPTSGQPPNGSP
jgi:hypothetical protein